MVKNTFVSFVTPDANSRNFSTPYVFKEYPKYVTLKDGTALLVKDADEEFAAVGDSETNNHALLLSRARDLGLKPHHRMSEDTLSKLIDEHLRKSDE